jgi:hypothetical protein
MVVFMCNGCADVCLGQLCVVNYTNDVICNPVT